MGGPSGPKHPDRSSRVALARAQIPSRSDGSTREAESSDTSPRLGTPPPVTPPRAIPRAPGGESKIGASPPLSLAIVGGGFSSLAALSRLEVMRLSRPGPIRVALVDPSARPGPGVAFGDENPPTYLANSSVAEVWLDLQVDGNLAAWLSTHRAQLGPEVREVSAAPDSYPPRRVMGAFFADRLKVLVDRLARRGVEVEVRRDWVRDIRLRAEAGLELELTDAGATLTADKVLLATGRTRPSALESLAAEAQARNPEGLTVWTSHLPGHRLDALPLDAHLLVLGASAAAVDVVNHVFGPHTGATFRRRGDGGLDYVPGPNRRTLTLCSRTGCLPKVRPRGGWVEVAPKVLTRAGLGAFAGEDGRLTADGLFRALAAEFRASIGGDPSPLLEPYAGASEAGLNDRALEILIDDMGAANRRDAAHPSVFFQSLLLSRDCPLPEIFAEERLAPDAQLRVREALTRFARPYASAIPFTSAERLAALLRAGRVRVVAGAEPARLTKDASAIRVDHTAPSGARGFVEARHIVDVTGQGPRSLAQSRDPLFSSLLQAGLVEAYARQGVDLGGVNIDPKTMSTVVRGEPSGRVYVVGEWTAGRLAAANSLARLHRHAALAVDDVLSGTRDSR